MDKVTNQLDNKDVMLESMKTSALNIRMSTKLKEALDREARKEYLSTTAYILRALAAHSPVLKKIIEEEL